MKQFIFSLIIVLSFYAVRAQRLQVYGDKVSSRQHRMLPCVVADSTVADTSLMELRYRFDFQRLGKPEYTLLRVQIGRRLTKQSDLVLYFSAIHNAYISKGVSPIDLDTLRQRLPHSGAVSNLFIESVLDHEEGVLTIVCGDFFTWNKPYVYRESQPQIDWTLCEERDSVCGYACHRAKARFRGRDWDVWYAPTIPLQAGPWKLSGLPGLIMRAETDGYRFTCTDLRQTRSPIYRNHYRPIRDLKTRERYRHFERYCYEHPLAAYAEGEEAYILASDDSGNIFYLDDSWTIPYDPIELE